MPGRLIQVALITLALAAATSAHAQTYHRRAPRDSRETEHNVPPPPASIDRRDSAVTTPGPLNGHPYWLSLAQCGGIYFKLNTLYADAAAHARVVKPDPKAVAENTRDLKEAIRIATTFFDAAERFLMTDRGLERDDAVLVYDPQERAAGDRVKSIEGALDAAKSCPALYQACQAAYPKACSEPLPPVS